MHCGLGLLLVGLLYAGKLESYQSKFVIAINSMEVFSYSK